MVLGHGFKKFQYRFRIEPVVSVIYNLITQRVCNLSVKCMQE